MGSEITFFALAVPAVLFAGVSKGGFGSGAAFAATPLLALILDPAQAVGLMLPLLMLMDVGALRPYWRQWDWRSARLLIAGALPGIGLGAAVFGLTDPDTFRLLIGAVAIGFVAWQGARAAAWLRPARAPMGPAAGLLAGLVAGFTSFISHAGGPPAAMFLLSRGLGKTRYQATTVIVFWAINLLKFLPYAALGFFSVQGLRQGVILAPVALIGVWTGVWFHRRVPERLFFGLTYLFLLATGAKLIWDGLG